ncbi:Diguanylate cyclase/phosphodiesterase with PAS/PAC and GAF sensor(S) [Methylorubrum extorquens]|uniref:Diguanylate cyclase/phosphodiesterase with PAS/PAC and GAF sensor(S) n=1 Tax=Methylorubrum extorquens TaxID=408 RepID=A0A2N9AJT4_METEX|nr:Diguanylate cyclase/phosphodiesterase with PAS/PAC and GAF sensor(S) [Methylorubrum extorquens]
MYSLHPNEVERLKVLHDLEVFGSPPEPQYDAICRTTQALFGVPIALASLVGETEQRFKGRCGLEASRTPREVSFCTHTILSDEVLVVEDAAQDERFSANPLVTGEPHIRFYAGAPLVLSPGIHLGSLCIIDRTPRSFSPEQQEQLRDLAQTVVSQLRLSKAEQAARAGEACLRESEANYRLLADNSTDLIVRCTPDGTRLYVSPAAKRLLGYEPEELVGTKSLDFVHPEDVADFGLVLSAVGRGCSERAVSQQRYRHKNGSWLWVETSFSVTRDAAGAASGFVAVVRDISERKKVEHAMAHMARHDPLTGLPNRLHLREQLEQEIARTKRKGSGFALFCLDLDRFKLVNDTLGHQAGDTLLKVVAQRIRALLRTEDTVARLGGDEFVIIQTGCAGPADATRLAERLIEAMVLPIDLDGYPAGVGLSIGLALCPRDAVDADKLIGLADQALYRAKASGRNTFRSHAEGEATSRRNDPEQSGVFRSRDIDPIGSHPKLFDEVLSGLLEGSLDCVKLLDEHGRLLFMSSGGQRLMEVENAGSILGQCWLDFWEGEHHDVAQQALETAKAGEPARFRGFCPTAKGQPRWWDVSLSPMQGLSGSPQRILSVSRDATAQVELEARLRTTAQRYEALIEASATMVWRAEPDGSLIDSSGWEAYTGQPVSAYAGFGWLSTVHPDDQERVTATWREIFASQAAGSFEFRALCRDGSYRWTLTRAVPLTDGSGQVREWVGTDSDIHESKQATEAIRLQEERYRLAMLATQDAIWDHDLTSDAIEWSEGTYRLFGYSDAEVANTGAWWKSKIHPDDRARVTASLRCVIDGHEHRWSEEYLFEQGDGTYADVLDRGFVIRDSHGRAVRVVGAMHDVTEERRADAALRASEERLRLALRAGRMVAWELNLKTGQSKQSGDALDLLGIASGPASEFYDRVHPDDRAGMDRFIQGAESHQGQEFRYVHPAGSTLWLSAWAERTEGDRLVGITFDITERKRVEERAWRAANHDALTGLPNRRLFHQRLEQALTAAERGGTSVSLLLLDLDNLRDVNDTLGHDAGDAVLVEVAQRLQDGLRETDTVARLSGDEFALLLVEPLRLEHALSHTRGLIERLSQPFCNRGHTLSRKASIGVAAYPDHHRGPHDLLKDADIALYRAKVQGRNRAIVFAPEMRAETERRVSIASEVRVALAAGRIVPYYQPKVCFSTGAIVGFEALARWEHPEKGLLTPGYFGSAFDDPELATGIGDSILRQVAADLREWRERGLTPGLIAVNFASAEFRKPDLAGSILSVLNEHGVPPSLFEVEVTETVFLGHGSENVPATLHRLRAAGVLITLDDFGTGFASLTHLKQFPVGHLKVDQSFVRNMEQDSDDAAIVAAVVGLGRSIGVKVTAEGVETEGQAQRLSAMGCDYAQGYRYATPMAGSRVPWFLTHWRTAAVVEESQMLRLA